MSAISQLVVGANALPKADSFLEKKEETSVSRVFEEFKSKGGSLYRLGDEISPFQLLPNDVIFPSCSSGKNRSQTVWKILESCDQKIQLMSPHAVRGGNDPYNGRIKKWCDPSKFKLKPDGFVEWAGGSKKVSMFGEESFQQWWEKKDEPETLGKMKEYYDKVYYETHFSSETRRVYITFQENAHVHLQRLSETNHSLDNVVVLYFAFPIDPLKCPKSQLWKESTRKIEAYIGLAEIVNAGLDLRMIKNGSSKDLTA